MADQLGTRRSVSMAPPGSVRRYASLPVNIDDEGNEQPMRARTHTGRFVDEDRGSLRAYSFAASELEETWMDYIFETLLPSGSIHSSVFNLCSATLGAGALSLPMAFREAGVALCFSMLVIGALSTVFSIWLLIDIYERTGIRTYEESTQALAGRPMRMVVEVFTILFCYGTAVAYVIAVGDVMRPLEELSEHLTKPVVMIGFWALFMVPTSCLREVNSLRFTSFIGVLVMLYLMVAISEDTIHQFMVAPKSLEPVKAVSLGWTTILSMPVVLFAYTCQVNVFAIYDELEEREPRKMLKVGGYAMLLCLVVYSIVGIFGYARWGSQTHGDILTNYDFATSPVLIKGTFVTMGLAITMAFPLNIFPMRPSLNLMLVGKPQLETTAAHIIETLLIAISILLLALFVPGIDIVFSLLGSTASSLLCFIFPSYLAYCAGTGEGSILVSLGMVLLVLMGLGIGILGTWVTITEHILKN
mmetsp:Transcript_92929/g.161029  ORF Transcript_92929/g.161029 Transcript_92929/m.161029 type:complete len:473 (-) Transcript_92929:1485-2903(-)